MPAGGFRIIRGSGAVVAAAVLLLATLVPAAFASGPAWLPPVTVGQAGAVDPTVAPATAMDQNGDVLDLWADPVTSQLGTADRAAGAGDVFGGESDVGDGLAAVSAPQVAFDSGGDAIAVWVEGSEVWEAYQPSGQGWGSATQIDAEPGAQSDPQIAMDSSGDATAVWLDNDGSNEVVQAAFAPAGSGFVSPPQTLSADGADAAAVQLAEDPAGDTIAVWQRSDGTHQQIQFAYSAAGSSGTFAAAQTLDPEAGDQTSPAVASDGGGDMTVAWAYDDGTDEVIQTAYSPSGTPSFGAPSALTQDSDGNASLPRVASDAGGDAAVVWTLDTGGVTYEAQADVGSGGSFPSAGSQTTLGPADGTQSPRIAVDPSGDAIAVWVNSSDVVDASVAASGHAFAAATALSAGGDPASDPTLAVDGNGNAVAGWLESTGGGETADVSGYDGQSGPTLIGSLSFPTSPAAPVSAVAGRGLTFDVYPTDVWPAIGDVTWSFGDGTPAVSGPDDVNVTHTFSGPGTYTVTATVTNADGNQTPFSQSVTIAASAPAVPDGGLTQLPSPNDCVSSTLLGCGTLDPFGTNLAYQPIVSPDGRNVYLVGFFGGIVEFSRDPSTGALTQIGCVTSNPAGEPTCTEDNFLNAELGNPAALAISPDGTDVYAVAQSSQSIVTFSRNPATGVLTEVTNDCWTSVPGAASCSLTPGLAGAYGVAVSPDGQNVYVAAYPSGNSGDVAEFTRDPNSGALTPIGGNACISDGSFSPCPVQSATGLAEAIGVLVSPDGNNVYVATGGTGGNGDIAELVRGAGGALQPLSGANACIGPGMLNAPTPTPCPTAASAIDGPEDMAISPDGRFLYANSNPDSAVIVLSRDTGTGALAQAGCVEGSGGPGGLGCTVANGINGALGVALSPNGANLYASGSGDNAEAAFSVNPATGQLTQLASPFDCISSNATGCGQNDATGLDGPRRVTVSPDGRNVYVAGQGSQSVVELSRSDAPSHIGVAVAPSSIEADGSSTATITATVTDGEGNGVTGEQVSFAANDAGVTIGSVTPRPDGTYTATLRSSTTVHAITITATDSAAGLSAQTSLAQTAVPPSVAPTTTGTTGTTTTTTTTSTTPTSTVAPPVLAASVDAAPVSGQVLVRLPGSSRFVPLTSLRSIPVGSTIDATHGSVTITAATPGGGTETGTFFDGEFILRQTRSGEFIAVLTGGSFAACSKSATKRSKNTKKTKKLARIETRSKRPTKKVIRSLWANVHGNFSTQGAYGSAAVSGTEWLTEDRCDGTYFRVTRHEIIVTSFKLHNRRTTLKQGHSYVAPAR